MFLKYLLFVLLISLLKAQKLLKFSPDGEFVIVQFTDLHLCENPSHDQKTLKLMNDILKLTSPNIAVITGDIISAKSYHGQPDFFRDCWRKFIQPFRDNKVQYALALGAEDLSVDLTQSEIEGLEKTSEWSLYAEFYREGIDFAYSVPIQGSDTNLVATNLWIFNSHSKGCLGERNSWGCVDDKQIEWYEKTSKELRGAYGENIHQMAFLHTPLPEFRILYNEHEYYGTRNERVSCPLINTKLFDAFKRNKGVKGVFVGHDHLNDYGGILENIELVYGRRTGYGGYASEDNRPRGARVIKLKEIRNENRVERSHFLVLEQNNKLEYDKEKAYQIRRGFKQSICKVADTEESIAICLTWVMMSLLIIAMGGIGFNRLINTKLLISFQKKERRDPLKVLKMERSSSNSEFMV